MSKTLTSATLATLLPEGRREAFLLTLSGLRATQYVQLAAAMPKSIEACLESCPLISDLIAAGELYQVTRFLEARIIAGPCALMNVANRMTSAQIVFSAQQIAEQFKHEPLATIVLALERGAAGYYGTTYHQLDTAILVGWIRQALEEQAMYLERNAQRSRQAEADAPVDYAAYIERRKREREQAAADKERKFQQRKEEIAAELEYLERSKLTDDQTRARLEVAAILRERYGNLAFRELNGFALRKVDGWCEIFAPSQEAATEILGEALVRVQLKKKQQQTKTPTP